MVPGTSTIVPTSPPKLTVIRSRAGRSTHVKSEVGMWPGCRYSAVQGGRTVVFEYVEDDVTCRRCRQAYDFLVPGERMLTGERR